MGRFHFSFILLLSFSISLFLYPRTVSADLKHNYYADICPDVEKIVRKAVEKKFNQTSIAGPATLRLFFHDCFVEGCDASIMIQSTSTNKAEKDHPDNLSLAGDGFDTVIKAKEAVDEVSSCKNKVSCADILALATRDVVALAGGPSYEVELGRLDGLSSTNSSVDGKLPQPTFNLTQLNSLFSANGLKQSHMIALSAAHTIGFAHCAKFSNRIYNYSQEYSVDPTINKTYAVELQKMCPQGVDPRIVVNMDPNTPNTFDNNYFKNLQQQKGLFTSDQVLYTDSRSRSTVNSWASDSDAFNDAFVNAMKKLGRVGVKTGSEGNIRHDCSVLNS